MTRSYPRSLKTFVDGLVAQESAFDDLRDATGAAEIFHLTILTTHLAAYPMRLTVYRVDGRF